MRPNLVCQNCGKETTPYTNFCDWACQIELAKESGGKVHTPNGLPIQCIRADGLMLEIEHGDHPDYKFPVEVEYIGLEFYVEDEVPTYGRELTEAERERSRDETHALIYTDGSIAVTLYECTYAMWHLKEGDYVGGHQLGKTSRMEDGEFHHGDWKLTEASRLKIINSVKPKEPPP